MAVDGVDGADVGDAHVVGGDADDLAELLVHLIDNLVSVASPHYGEQPEIGELRRERRRYVSKVPECGEIWNDVVGQHRGDQPRGRPRGDEQFCDSHCLRLN